MDFYIMSQVDDVEYTSSGTGNLFLLLCLWTICFVVTAHRFLLFLPYCSIFEKINFFFSCFFILITLIILQRDALFRPSDMNLNLYRKFKNPVSIMYEMWHILFLLFLFCFLCLFFLMSSLLSINELERKMENLF